MIVNKPNPFSLKAKDYMLEVDEALKLINNLDMREPLRRYGPKWSTVFVSRSGDIVGVYRHKEFLSTADISKDAASHPETFYFIATPGDYTTREALLKRVNDAVWAYNWEDQVITRYGSRWMRLKRWFQLKKN